MAGILTADSKLLFYHCLMLVRKVGRQGGSRFPEAHYYGSTVRVLL